ncbi:bifunctional diaminohydroxyphosphoribosylaminopyrimidine deaminase/5-amino-6-(5-phosphoribosylamino)uracil reductase RibD [Eoetvoesia caeni]|nr:bifunctional diaminohydroxyphosphoribosylaminopyrimidine deaminase/5-amino-6-(5-phosphoribosylamino)uracil reductase RibD [Eoetvoesiella caeni]
MMQAIELSHQSLYITAPNPRVACLIVKEGQLLASGVTQQAGGPHAEVMALRQAQERGLDVKGATFYVTLEPCSHHGRTPPCADALVKAAPARVVVAMADPNPLVAGQGIARLRAAGIQVATSVCTEQALAVNPGFVARMTRGTPWLWLKSAASLDGQTALRNGVSQWITGPQARADGHHWRARSCVVLSGLGTVRADNPQLSVRDVATTRQPIKAIIDTRLEIDEKARLLDGSKTWIFTCNDNPEKSARLAQLNAQVVVMPGRNGGVDLPAVMRWLGQHEVNEVHVEGGARLNGALLQSGCVDELLVYLAPIVLGQGLGMYQLQAMETLDQALRFEFFETLAMGADVRLRARLGSRWQELLKAVGGP